jgi:hypothetical protein
MSGFYRTPAIPFTWRAISSVRYAAQHAPAPLLHRNIETY